MAITMATTLIRNILSWKKITCRTGTTGKPKVPTTLEKREDASKINPTPQIANSCHTIWLTM